MFLVLQGAKQAGLTTLTKKEPSLLAVTNCGICHSDRKAFHTPPGGMELPRVLGHEISGLLTVDLPKLGLLRGERVVLWPALTCCTCRYCLSGRQNLCPQIKLFGYHLDGGFCHTVHAYTACSSNVNTELPVPYDGNIHRTRFLS